MKLVIMSLILIGDIMTSVFSKELTDKSIFKWPDLHATTLKISVVESIDDLGWLVTVVMGLDEKTGESYLLHRGMKRTYK